MICLFSIEDLKVFNDSTAFDDKFVSLQISVY